MLILTRVPLGKGSAGASGGCGAASFSFVDRLLGRDHWLGRQPSAGALADCFGLYARCEFWVDIFCRLGLRRFGLGGLGQRLPAIGIGRQEPVAITDIRGLRGFDAGKAHKAVLALGRASAATSGMGWVVSR
jgi:hypothetical protein